MFASPRVILTESGDKIWVCVVVVWDEGVEDGERGVVVDLKVKIVVA